MVLRVMTEEGECSKEENLGTPWPALNAETSLTHYFHHTVTEESATALKGTETFQIQRPDIFFRIPIYHPLCQVPDGRSKERLRYQPMS